MLSSVRKVSSDTSICAERYKAVSFYDSYFLEHCKPAVTSLRFDEANLGIIACEELIGRIEQRTYSTRVYTGYKVMLRASTR